MAHFYLALPSGRAIELPTSFIRFELWRGHRVSDTYGGKAVLDYKGEPVFAELAILRMLQDKGWDGVWIDTYRRKFRKALPPHFCDLPTPARDFLNWANAGRKWPAGCFDVLAWKDGAYLFTEAKRRGKDAIRPTQKQWLESVLGARISLDSFLLVEWDA